MQKEKQGHVEIFDEDATITLFDDDNNPIDFFEVASVEYDEKFYAILQPIEEMEGMEDDEAVIFEFSTEEGSDEKMFKPVFDEKLLDTVFSVYLSAMADYETTACGSGCEGGGCGGGGCGVANKSEAKKATKK
ncbi:MAG: DUF1292 domain-containing protein [Firmicutes bacterium]|nr:DUF1292 domain-containing protein [Bacillota bacterium]